MSEAYNDDLFEDTKMTFGQHLEELRGVLFKSVIGLVIGFLVGLYFANDVVNFVQVPLKKALREYYLEKAEKSLNTEFNDSVPAELIATVQDAQLEPKKEMFAVKPLWAAIQAANPDKFDDIKFVPHRFVPNDIKKDEDSDKCVSFCGRLRESGAQSSETPEAVIWALMNEEERALVARLAAEESVTDKQRLHLIRALNRIVELADVYESKAFQKIVGDDLYTQGTITRLRKQAVSLTKARRAKEQADSALARAGNSSSGEPNSKAFTDAKQKLAQAQTVFEDAQRAFDQESTRRLNKFLIATAFSDEIRRPQVMLFEVSVWRPTETNLQALNAHESFIIWLKAGLIAGLVIACPWIFWQIWSFVAAGLYPHEQRFVYVFMPFSIILFVGGACMAFFFVFKPVLAFLFSFNRAMNIDPDPRIGEWLSFVLILPLGFGIAFQLPLVMLFLNRLGIVKVESFIRKWRMAVLIIFVVSMFLTPADPISMLMMACPLTALYFLGIVMSKWMPRFRRPMPEGYEPS